jgi:type VI protein secretion system component VasF
MPTTHQQTLKQLQNHIAQMATHQRERHGGQLIIQAEHSLRTLLHAIESEPELPGTMPDEMWELIRNDKAACEHTIRQAVILTKQNIQSAIAKPPTS